MIALVLGGARSGKSAVAEARAARLSPPVTYIATAEVDPSDAAWVERIEAHRRRRDPSWSTVEAGADLPAALRGVAGTVLVDSLGTWLARNGEGAVDVTALVRALEVRDGDSVLVSEEVGLGVHPSAEAGRRFRDELGVLNQAVATIADDVLLVVAGRVIPLERP